MTKGRRPTEEAYAELQHAYDFYNEHLFEGRLPPCMITFQREKSTMGYFSARRFVRRDGAQADEIALNPEFFAVYPMMEVLQTITHEMTHLWQYHLGTPSRTCYHNTEWANKMESIGLMPSSTGAPGGKRTGQKIADYVIPGGKLEAATRILLSDGFAISWLDRFPAKQPQAIPAWPTDSVSSSTLHSPTEDVVEADTDPHEALFAAAFTMPAAELQQALGLEVRGEGNRSNRDKYTCPECSISAWGKPKLRLKCGDCDVMLVPE